MPLIYRSMKVDGGKPLCENTARGLGVRIGTSPEDDIAADDAGQVHPDSGGMSVVPSWRDLEAHRIPKRLKHIVTDARGSNRDACWRRGEGPFENGPVADDLVLRKDSDIHAFVEPARSMSAAAYIQALVATRDQWIIDED
ncbi:MAG TPA: hypothetical protein VMP01_05160 [Pirellulaceae bacterium]|nr:hypothetical protein [Pirellulaceae bacterium]